MKQIISKILILVLLFSIGAELSAVSFDAGANQYVMTDDMTESGKKEKEEVEKDKILALSSFIFLPFKKNRVSGFLTVYTTGLFKLLPEVPPKQV